MLADCEESCKQQSTPFFNFIFEEIEKLRNTRRKENEQTTN